SASVSCPLMLVLQCYGDHRVLLSFPTRRSSDLYTVTQLVPVAPFRCITRCITIRVEVTLKFFLQYSPLITKNEPRIVPANLDFCLANLKLSSSAGTSIPSDSLKPTARFLGLSLVYMTLTTSPSS